VFPAVTTYLQTSPSSGFHSILILAKWRKHTHTHKGPSNKPLLFHKTPFERSTAPSTLLFHKKDFTGKYLFSNYNGNIYLQLCSTFPF